MKEYWLKIKAWWSDLGSREKRAVIICASVLGLFIGYQWIWSPIVDQTQFLRERIGSNQRMLAWMQSADHEIQQLEKNGQKSQQAASPIVLLKSIKSAVSKQGMDKQLAQLKQSGSDAIEVQFKSVEFDRLMKLLIALSQKHAVTVNQMSVVANGAPGIVNVNVILKI